MDSRVEKNCSVEPVDIMDSDVFSNSTGLTIFSIYFFLICLSSVVENSIILAAIIRVKRLHKRRNILIFNLALTDLAAGVIYPCSVIFNQTYMESIGLVVGIASGFTILSIAAERFLKIVIFTNTKAHIGTRNQLLGVSIIVWVIPAAILLPISFYDYILHRVIFFTLGPLCIVVIMTGISILYFAIFVKIHSHDKRMSGSLNGEGRPNYRFTKLVLKAYVVIVVVYAVCWLPWAIESLRIMFTMYYGFQDKCIVSSLAFYIGVAMVLLNSAVNPIIYWRRLPDFREGISEFFGCASEKSCCYREAITLEDSSVQHYTENRSTNSTDDKPTQLKINSKIHDSMC